MANVIVNLNIDFGELKKQKSKLLDLIWLKKDHPAWGIIELIDSIQDQAVDSNGIPNEEVFG